MTFKTGNRQGGRLTAEQVLAIRERYAHERITQGALAREYMVSIGTIRNVLDWVTWQNVGRPQDESMKPPHHRVTQPTQEQIDSSASRLAKLLTADQGSGAICPPTPPSLYSDPVPYEEPELSDDAARAFNSARRARLDAAGSQLDELLEQTSESTKETHK